MSRLAQTFSELKARGRPGLIVYVTAGDPDLARSAEILLALDRAGADIIEVGVPFSDPLADGPVIQRATERAIRAGTTLRGTLALVGQVRPQLRAPVVLFSYANPILRMGPEMFAKKACAVGVDGVLVLDLPIDEATSFQRAMRGEKLDTIFLLSPTSTAERIRRAAALGSGFLYGISRLAVTGARETVADGAVELVARIRSQTSLPVAVGFGISKPDHVTEVGRWADAAVVGSAVVDVIAGAAGAPDLPERVEAFVRWLRGA